MRVIAAYLLAELGGNNSPSVADIEKILGSVGVTLDDDAKARAEKLIADLKGKKVADVIAQGKDKLASAPAAGFGGAAAPAAAAAGGAAPAAAAAKEEEAAAPAEESEEVRGACAEFRHAISCFSVHCAVAVARGLVREGPRACCA